MMLIYGGLHLQKARPYGSQMPLQKQSRDQQALSIGVCVEKLHTTLLQGQKN